MPELPHNDEFMELVTLHQTRLYGYIFALVGNAEDADDLFQQTILVLWRKFADFERGSDFSRWAWTTAKFEVRNFQRVSRRSHVIFSDRLVDQLMSEAGVEEDTSDDPEREHALQHCVEKLPEADRELLDLCYKDRNKIKDIATRLGRSSQSVCNSLGRIRTTLFNCIQRVLNREGDQ
jgi:RNA polymerase sigma-70 factor (ECF subfamily)